MALSIQRGNPICRDRQLALEKRVVFPKSHNPLVPKRGPLLCPWSVADRASGTALGSCRTTRGAQRAVGRALAIDKRTTLGKSTCEQMPPMNANQPTNTRAVGASFLAQLRTVFTIATSFRLGIRIPIRLLGLSCHALRAHNPLRPQAYHTNRGARDRHQAKCTTAMFLG